jgi:putative ABC transport system substrate-binding protein
VDNETFAGFKAGMKNHGWIENVNIRYIVPGPAKVIKKLDSVVQTALEQDPDLIFVSSTPATQAVKRALGEKSRVPVIFCPVNDPVSADILKNPLSPEGMITGLRPPASDEKRFEWLMRIAPESQNILVPYTPADDCSIASREDALAAAKDYSVNIIQKALEKDTDLSTYLKSVPENIDAVFLPRDSNVEAKIERFAAYALKEKLPLCAPSYQQVKKGALFAYGFIHYELGLEAAEYADRVLKGVHPGDLPVKFGQSHLVLNKKTAASIGITFNSDSISNAKAVIK